MKILVVEDENALREVIVRSLEKERYVVESASSFREASLKINDYDYDCIVLTSCFREVAALPFEGIKGLTQERQYHHYLRKRLYRG